MKIERLNENQIRCTLTASDLANRKIRMGELAYGTEKARELFHDMMVRAQNECGFDTADLPLMIEAIPMNSDSLVLIITKVDDPAELDTRFSRFTPEAETDLLPENPAVGADEILRAFDAVKQNEGSSKRAKQKPVLARLMRKVLFPDLDTAIRAAAALNGSFHGPSALYRARNHTCYTLILHQGDHTPEEFNKICNLLSEYAEGSSATRATEAVLREHADIILKKDAIRYLRELS